MRARYTDRRRGHEDAKLSLTAMIDVVFLLLIFFVTAVKPEDILTQLDVSRPQAAPGPHAPPLTLTVDAAGFTLNGRRFTPAQMDAALARLAGYSRNLPVVIRCTADSQHAALVQALDICTKSGLTRLSLMSR